MPSPKSNSLGESAERIGLQTLVTGGTGLIGRQVVKKLKSLGMDVGTVSLDSLKVEGADHHIEGDLTDFDFCMEITKNVDYVFHLAGIKGSPGSYVS